MGSPSLEELENSVRSFRATLLQLGGESNHLKASRADVLEKLGDALLLMYHASGRTEALEDCISAYEERLGLCPIGNPQRGLAVRDLARAVSWLSEDQEADTARLDRRVSLWREALELFPLDHVDRGELNLELARAFQARFDRHNGGSICLTEAITNYRAALQFCASGDPYRDIVLGKLATALQNRFELDGDLEDLTESVAFFREWLDLYPVGEPFRDSVLCDLATALRDYFLQSGDSEVLDESIKLHREALQLRPPGHSERDTSLTGLANALYNRYDGDGDTLVLAETTALQREVLMSYPPGHALRDISLTNLAITLLAVYREQEDLSVLEESIGLHREALELCPPGHPSRDSSLDSLADALLTSFDQNGGQQLLTEAISLQREALALRPSGHVFHESSLNNLATALETLFENRGGMDTLDEAIYLYRQAVRLRRREHTQRPNSLNNLACALRTKFEQEGNRAFLDEVVELHREALQLRPPGNPHRSMSLNNLGDALWTQFEQDGDKRRLDEAIDLQREALQLRPPGHSLRASGLNNLANSLCTRFDQQGGFETLSEAIALFREALYLRAPGHPARDDTLSNLALALQTKFVQQGGLDTLSEAIELQYEALSLRPASHPLRSRMLNNLADALHTRVKHGGNMAILMECIKLHREAVQLCPPGQPFRDSFLCTLAIALQTSFRHSGSPDTITEAIALHREALLLRPVGHTMRLQSLGGLGAALCEKSEANIERQSWDEAVEIYREAVELCPLGHPARAGLFSGVSRCLLAAGNPTFDFVDGITHVSRALADDFCSVRERLQNALLDLRRVENAYNSSVVRNESITHSDSASRILELYTQAIRLLPRAANFGLDLATQLQAVAGSEEISRNAAARALQIGHVADAVEMLEEGRGVFWSQALRIRASGLDDVPEDDRRTLERIFSALEAGGRSLSDVEKSVEQRERELENRRQLSEQAEALVAKIRTSPGLERFLMPASFINLMQSLPRGFVVVLVASNLGCHALMLGGGTNFASSLELKAPPGGFASARIRTTLPRGSCPLAVEATDDDTNRAFGVSRKSKVAATLDTTLHVMWSTIVKPVIDSLKLQQSKGSSRPRVWWCTTGDFSLLPIHAAGVFAGDETERQSADDYMVSSYIPTIAALTRARKDWQAINRTQAVGLLVSEPAPGRGYSPIINVYNEAETVRNCFAVAGAAMGLGVQSPTTVTSVLSILQSVDVNILHMACHGVQHENPLQSAFVLGDGDLSIEELMRLDLRHATLAFLSACQTAQGDAHQPDQAVHLAASMLFCGFRSVIGTLWSMDDQDGPYIARRVYDSIFKKQELNLDDIPYALDDATRTLRDTGVPAARWAAFVHLGG